MTASAQTTPARFRFHDSMENRVVPFDAIEPGVVRMYNCGPTVYSYQHIGNYRAHMCWDVLRRALSLGGFRVRQVLNITDVGHLTVDDVAADSSGEDKLEAQSRKERMTAWEIAKKYSDHYFSVRARLSMLDAEVFPRATAHIREMIEIIEGLIEKGHAYATPAGNVYFEVSTFPRYGRLSNNTVESLVAGSRVEVLDEKRHPADFALWKRDPGHQMQWDSPWGRGFPGWHIECSAMSRKYLGDTIDIHTGGEDNLFPHHECEIAQSEAFTGRPFARIWLHNRHLLVNGEKMSKRAGTQYVLEDIEAKGFAPRSLRYYLLATHYRQPMNFTWDALAGADEAVRSLDAMVRKLAEDPAAPDDAALGPALDAAGRDFLSALTDDLNVSAALAVVHRMRGELNRRAALSPADMARARERIAGVDSVLGLQLLAQPAAASPEDAEIQRLVDERVAAKAARNFARADEIRRELSARGIVIEDTKSGAKWRRG